MNISINAELGELAVLKLKLHNLDDITISLLIDEIVCACDEKRLIDMTRKAYTRFKTLKNGKDSESIKQSAKDVYELLKEERIRVGEKRDEINRQIELLLEAGTL